LSPGASGVAAPAVPSVQERIERAVVTGSVDDLRGIRSELERLVDAREGTAAPSDRYDLAYVTWRICQELAEDDKKERRKLLKDAQRELDLVLKAKPDDAEAHALRGSVIGDRIGGVFSGMSLGPKASKSLNRAFELDPKNPRVALQRGVSYFYTPKAFGGGPENALQELERAQQLFQAEEKDRPWPNWGRVDALAWLGLVLAQSGRVEEARAAYKKALQLEPDHAWIRRELLPALEASEPDER